MKFLLDTTTVSDYLRGNQNVIETLHSTKPRELAVTTITQFEIHYGMLKKPTLIPKYEKQLQELYEKIFVLEFHDLAAIKAAQIKNQLCIQGKPIGVPDILIGAIATFYDLIVVTSNTKDFERIEGLSVEDWKSTL